MLIISIPMLTHLFPMHAFSTPENLEVFWCFQVVEKVYIGNKWVKQISVWSKNRENGFP